jgi:hypothetical protein
MEANTIVSAEPPPSTPLPRLKLKTVSIQKVSDSVMAEMDFAGPSKLSGYLCTCDSNVTCCA